MDVNVFQDGAIGTFAAGMKHNLEEATHMFRSLQAEHRITGAAVGTPPEGHTAVWSTLGGICDLVIQHGEILGGLRNNVGIWLR